MKKILLLFIINLLLSACGNEKKSNEPTNETNVIPNELVGEWESKCSKTDNTNQAKSTNKRTFAIDGSMIGTDETYSYTDTKCEGSIESKIQFKGKYSGGDSVTMPSGAKTLDLDYSSVLFTIYTDALLQALNSNVPNCKFQKNVSTELVGKKDCVYAISGTSFDIFKITNNQLQLGDTEAIIAAIHSERIKNIGLAIYTKK